MNTIEKKLIARIQQADMPNFKTPYPFFIYEDGTVGRQDFWKGFPIELLGFADKPKRHVVDFYFEEFKQNIDFAIGKYPVFRDIKDNISTLTQVVESVEL